MKKNPLKPIHIFLIIVMALTLLRSAPALALTSDEQNAADQFNKQMQRDNERIFEEEQRKLEEQKLLQQSPKIEVAPETKSAPKKKQEKCFLIKEIILDDSKSLLKKERAALVKNYQGKCLSLTDIDNLRIDINNFYIEKGYIMSRAYLKPGQNIKDGSLEFEIKEGEVEEISINGGKSFSDRVRLSTAFPYAKSQSFNLRDIEQGLDQINRLQSSSASLKILPGKEEGKSIIQITNNETRTTHASIGYDNYGQKSTGERRRVVTLQQDNLLRLNDNFYLNYSHDQEGNNRMRHSQNIFANFSIPYGYWLYTVSTTDSKYLSTIQLQNSTLQSTGNSRSYIFDVNRVIHRNKISTTSANGSITTTNTESFADGSKLDNSSRKLTILDLGLKNRLKLNNSSISFGIDYVRGLNSFGALQDQPNMQSSQPKAQYEMLKINAALYKRFSLLNQNFSYRGNVVGQKSKDTLFSSEQINIGDPFSVRGFKNNSVSADSGGYIRNEIGLAIPALTEKFYINKMLQGTELFVGYDSGMVKSMAESDASLNGKDRAYLSGWAGGIRKYGKYLDYNLTYSQALTAPSFVKTNQKEVYFSITLSI